MKTYAFGAEASNDAVNYGAMDLEGTHVSTATDHADDVKDAQNEVITGGLIGISVDSMVC